MKIWVFHLPAEKRIEVSVDSDIFELPDGCCRDFTYDGSSMTDDVLYGHAAAEAEAYVQGLTDAFGMVAGLFGNPNPIEIVKDTAK